jgi:protein SCO1/2
MLKRIALGFLLLLTLGSSGAAPALKAGVFEPPRLAPEFSLSASDGKALTLARYRGKLVLLVFGFTHCPEVCPTTLARLAQARKALSAADAAEVQVVYLTVDPERDDALRIKQYLAAFDPSFVGGTGTPGALEAVRKNYGVVAAKVPGSNADGYGMSHSTAVFLIDREGRLRAMMPYGHGPADFTHDIQLLLAQR